MDRTSGLLTTGKLQALLDASFLPHVKSRRDLAPALTAIGEKISTHGVEAWFRHVDSNYNLKRDSLTEGAPSYQVPKRRLRAILELFHLLPEQLEYSDTEFRSWCFQQVRERPPAESEQGSAATLLPGREAAWTQLTEGLARAKAGEPSFVLLNGPPGIGKSHLVSQFAVHADSTPSSLVFSAACDEHTGLPLMPIVESLRAGRGRLIAAGDRFERQFHQIFDAYADQHHTGLESPKVFLELMSLFGSLARDQTVVLCIDDLQLADETTARFLHYLSSHVAPRRDLRLVVVASYRTNGASDAARHLIARLEQLSIARHVRLEPLTQASLNALLDEQLDWPLTPRAFAEVWHFSLGRIGTALEFLNLLVHKRVLCTRAGHTDLAPDFDPNALPNDVDAIPPSLLACLGQEARDLLTLGSVLGLTFTLDTIQELRPQWALKSLLAAIEEAEQHDILWHDRDQFRFRNPAFARTLYQSLGATARMRLHLEVAGIWKGARSLTELQLVSMAHHLRRAGALVPAAELIGACHRATYAAASLAAWPQVIELAQVILGAKSDAAIPEVERARLLRVVASAWHQTGNPDNAIDYLRQALDSFRSIQNQTEIARTLNEVVRIRGNFGRLPDAEDDDLDELISHSRTLASTDPRLASRVFDAVASRMMYHGNHREAMSYAIRAKEVLPPNEACTERALACIGVALGHLRQLEMREALANLDDALYTALEVNDPHTAGRALQRLTVPLLAQGRLDQVESTFERIVALEHPLVRTGEMSIPLASLLTVHSLRGRADQAKQVFDEATLLIRETGYFWSAVNVVTAQASCLVAQGRRDTALDTLADAMDMLQIRPRDRSILHRYGLLLRGEEVPPDAFAAERSSGTQSATGLDLNAIAKFCLDLELALEGGVSSAIEAGYSILHQAYRQGIRFSLGWPFCIPHLMGRALLAMARHHEACYYLVAAHQLCQELGAAGEARSVTTTLRLVAPDLATALEPAPGSPHLALTTPDDTGLSPREDPPEPHRARRSAALVRDR